MPYAPGCENRIEQRVLQAHLTLEVETHITVVPQLVVPVRDHACAIVDAGTYGLVNEEACPKSQRRCECAWDAARFDKRAHALLNRAFGGHEGQIGQNGGCSFCRERKQPLVPEQKLRSYGSLSGSAAAAYAYEDAIMEPFLQMHDPMSFQSLICTYGNLLMSFAFASVEKALTIRWGRIRG